jgi:hypothetical protein
MLTDIFYITHCPSFFKLQRFETRRVILNFLSFTLSPLDYGSQKQSVGLFGLRISSAAKCLPTQNYTNAEEMRTQSCLYGIQCHDPSVSAGEGISCLIQRPGFDSRRYQVFCEVVGLERGPLSLVSTIEELLEGKGSGSGLEIQEYDRRGSASMTTRRHLCSKSWHWFRRQAAVARSV